MSNLGRTVFASPAVNGVGRFVSWLGISVWNRSAKRNPDIDCDVDDNDRSREHKLHVARQPGRIDDLNEIVLDEASRVARLPDFDAKVVLQIGQWAYTTGQLDKDRPGRRRKMNHWHPAPPSGERTTENGKQDKCQVEQENAIGGKTKIHEDVDTEGQCQASASNA